MKKVTRLILKILRGALLAGLLFGVYMLYRYHKEGYQVVLYNMGEGYKIAWTTMPGVYGAGAEFCKSATALVVAIPLVVVYWIVATIIGDTIRTLGVLAVSERKVEKVINDDLIAQIRSEREVRESVKTEHKHVVVEGEGDIPAPKVVNNVPVKKAADASKTYVGAGAMGRKLLDAKHSEAPDIFEDEGIDEESVSVEE